MKRMREMGQSGQFGRTGLGKGLIGLLLLCGLSAPLGAEQVADLSRDGVGIIVDAEPRTVDLARDFYVTIKVTAPSVVNVSLPNMDDRFKGFKVPGTNSMYSVTTNEKDGRKTTSLHWQLRPDPLASSYRLAPFVVQVDDRKFPTQGVPFDAPVLENKETGAVEIDPSRELPPFSWKRVGIWSAVGAVGLLVLVAAYFIFRKVRQIVRVHRMNPYERALYELDRLLRKGLPGRGLYKDFYVELTMVVRRYIARRYGVRAPNLTTDEFLRTASSDAAFPQASIGELKAFLESADLVKFAGLESTPEMADGATGKALNYLTTDNQRKEGAK